VKKRAPNEGQIQHRCTLRIRHDLDWTKFCWLLENDSQQHKTVSQSSWHNYGVQAGELIRNEVVMSNATLIGEILWIWACVDSPDRDDEPKAISGSNFATTPCVHERDVVVRSHQRRIGFCYGFVTDEVLAYP